MSAPAKVAVMSRRKDPARTTVWRVATGRTLKALRVKRGMSKGALAEKSGFLRQSLIRFECGGTLPDLATLSRLAEALDTETSVLVFNIERRVKAIAAKTRTIQETPEPVSDPVKGSRASLVTTTVDLIDEYDRRMLIPDG